MTTNRSDCFLLITTCFLSFFVLTTSFALKKEQQANIPPLTSFQQNLLSKEQSPYLLQHATNPIWWQTWSKETLDLAQKENKPIFLSIGYATCHWCHVMEGDSFEKEDVASVLNQDFISIKVDREERPDIDHIYMTAARALGSKGGWPLTVVMTPTGKPFFAATFISHNKLIELLSKITNLWHSKDRTKLLQTGQQVQHYLNQTDNQQQSKQTIKITDNLLSNFYKRLEQTFDLQFGGFGSAPKFPNSMSIMTLFRIYHRTKEKKALHMALTTLDAMARGGIHDHIGGGFHRYSTDKFWLIPHFEKMLYDNALLLLSYTEAYQISKKNEYKVIAKKIIDYLQRNLLSPNGGFYAAEDADSEKAEGKFYVWTYDELQKILTQAEFEHIQTTYGVTKKGNFNTQHFSAIEKAAGLKGVHDSNILYLDHTKPLPYLNSIALNNLHHKLLKVRENRVRPPLDNHIITAWNGLIIAALAKASIVFNEQKYKELATNAAYFILKELYIEHKLKRNFTKTASKHFGYLEDYAFFIFGLLELYQANQNPYWYKLSTEIQDIQNQLFWSTTDQQFYDTEEANDTLIVRTRKLFDNAIPSGNAMSVYNLLRLASISYDDSYVTKAQKILHQVYPQMNNHPSAFPFMLCAVDYLLDTNKEIAIIGPVENSNVKSLLKSLNQHFIPNKVIAAGIYDKLKFPVPLLKNKPLINKTPGGAYVCEDKICKLPTLLHDKVLDYAKKTKHYKLE